MDKNNIQKIVVNATKWSSITEITAKIVSPITNMVLARIITPEAFGVVATITMIFSFTDMLTDAGFQKYLVQHEFKNENEKYKNANVAFWTNLGVSFVLWGFIIIFRTSIASMVGNPGLGNVIAIACVQLLLTSFSSIQMALYRRDFDFKTLFWVRLISVCIPIIITIPLALLRLSYWALIIGSICGQLSNAIILTIKSKWKPSKYYNIRILNEMLSFSLWTLLESISIWFSAWTDTLIIGSALNSYYLGLYKTSLNTVNALIALVTAAITPVLFSALSRYQNDEVHFRNTFYRVQSTVAYFLFPMGLGLFLYSDVATKIILGEKWLKARFIIGIWGLTSVIKVVLSDFNSECYRAKGRPKLSFLLQVIHLAFLIPACIISLRYGFNALVYTRALIRFQLVITSLFVMQIMFHVYIKDMFKHLLKPTISTLVMGIVALGLKHISNNFVWSLASIMICILIYVIILYLFAKEDYIWILSKIRSKRTLQTGITRI